MSSFVTDHPSTDISDLRVLVIEPYPLMRQALVNEIARAEGVDVVGEAGDSLSAARIVRAVPVDLVVTETHLESENAGITLCSRLKGLPTGPLVVVHASDNSPRTVTDCLTAGADSFVHKSFSPETLLDSMKRAAGLQRPWILGRESRTPPTASSAFPLTPREHEVLGLLLMRLTNDEIASRLHLARQTVKNHVSSIMRKLEVSTRRELFRGIADRSGGPSAKGSFRRTAGV
jgi:DNA-binding NarL/FixJ family response regulator